MNNKIEFITFEGVEGSGKSTQVKLLQDFFLTKNIETILTREPGGSVLAEEIRNLLINGAIDKSDGTSETLLNFAARRDHIEKLIKPALAQGKIVICDRFFDSTFAYQGYGYGVDLEIIRNIQSLAIKDFSPEITFLIDIDIENSFERINNRKDNNRYEKMDREFHKKVRNGFLEIAQNNPDRIVVLDGNDTIVNIHKKIINILFKI